MKCAIFFVVLTLHLEAVHSGPETSDVQQLVLESSPTGTFKVDWCPGLKDDKYYTDPDYNLTEYTVITGECVCAFVHGNLACPKGYFCPHGNSTAYVCPPGQYCPGNISQPTYCCPGYYCPDPTTMFVCPKDNYCRTGFVHPKKCHWGTICKEGATEEIKVGPILLAVFVISLLFLVFAVQEWFKKKQKLSITAEMSEMHDTCPLAPASTEDDITVKERETYNIRFENIGCTLPNGTTIMQGVTGEFKAGRMAAIMGPSGAGKTTVITLITGKFKKTDGQIYVNDVACEGLMDKKKLTGFVPQDDVMHRKLTVFDNLFHSAKMRLPREIKISDIKTMVYNTIKELGLAHVTHSIIGDEKERGISGGQRKRVNIGLELVADPSLLFLDEPTTGLDATTSFDLCKMLKVMAQRKNLNVIAVIHSPSPKAFMTFDDLLLLGKGGRTIFMGQVADSVAYFQGIGFTITDPHENPADYFMEVATGKVPRPDDPEFVWPVLFEMWDDYSGKNTGVRRPERAKTMLEQKQERDTYAQKYFSGLKSIGYVISDMFLDIRMWFTNAGAYIVQAADDVVAVVTGRDDPVRNTCHAGWQFLYCAQRAAQQVFRDRNAFISDQLIHFFIGVFISLVASALEFVGPNMDQICDASPVALQTVCRANVMDGYAFTGNFLMFGITFAGISAGLSTFGDERVIYWREASTGLITACYVLAKVLVDFVRVVFAGVFFYAAFQLNYTYEGNLSDLFEVIFMAYYASFSLGYLVSVIAPPSMVSLVAVLMAMLFAMKLSGTNDPSLKEIKDLEGLPAFPYMVSPPRYGVEAFYISSIGYYENVPKPYYDQSSTFTPTNENIADYKADGTEVEWMNITPGLETGGYELGVLSKNMVGMMCAGWFWLFVTFICMVSFDIAKKA